MTYSNDFESFLSNVSEWISRLKYLVLETTIRTIAKVLILCFPVILIECVSGREEENVKVVTRNVQRNRKQVQNKERIFLHILKLHMHHSV